MLNDCPSTQTMANFSDGTLPDTEHQKVVEHLAACRDCSEWMAVLMETKEALPHLFQEEATSQAAPVVKLPPANKRRPVQKRPFQWKPLLVAASISVVAAMSLITTLSSGPKLEGMGAAAVAERLKTLPASADSVPQETVMGFSSATTPAQSAFATGLLMTRSTHYLVTNDLPSAAATFEELEQLNLNPTLNRQLYVWKTWARQTRDASYALPPEVEHWEGRFASDAERPYLHLGELAEGSRIAILHQDQSFFRDLPLRTLRSELESAQALPGVFRSLETLELLALSPDPTDHQWQEADEAVRDLILLFQ